MRFKGIIKELHEMDFHHFLKNVALGFLMCSMFPEYGSIICYTEIFFYVANYGTIFRKREISITCNISFVYID